MSKLDQSYCTVLITKSGYVMKLFLSALILFAFPCSHLAGLHAQTYNCQPWSNSGLRMKGDITLNLSGLRLDWSNGKITQVATMVNPDDKLEGSVSDAKRIYVSDDSTTVFFVKRWTDYIGVNRTPVTIREAKQNTTTCHPIK